MHHDHGEPEAAPSFWRSRYAIGVISVAAVAGHFLLTEHLPHVVGALPFLLQWPTLLTLIMVPILLVMYGRLALTEETEMRQQFGDVFERYAQRTPRFIPGRRRWSAMK